MTEVAKQIGESGTISDSVASVVDFVRAEARADANILPEVAFLDSVRVGYRIRLRRRLLSVSGV